MLIVNSFSSSVFSTNKNIIYTNFLSNLNFKSLLVNSLSAKWLVDGFFARFFVWPLFNLGLFSSKIVDRGLFELFGAYGIAYKIDALRYLNSNTLEKEVKDLALIKDTSKKKSLLLFSNNVPDYALYIGLIALASTLGTLIHFFNFYFIIVLVFSLFAVV